MKNNTKAQVEFSDLMGPSSETPISLFLLRSKCWFANENEQKLTKELAKREAIPCEHHTGLFSHHGC